MEGGKDVETLRLFDDIHLAESRRCLSLSVRSFPLRFSWQRRRRGGWRAMVRRLLVSVGQLDKRPFVIRSSHEGDASRQGYDR